MSRGPYFGPAGIFSTDDPLSDRLQIEAEQYEDPSEDENDDDEDRRHADNSVEIFAWCTQEDWWDRSYIGDTEADLAAYLITQRKDHLKNCRCGDTVNFRYEKQRG